MIRAALALASLSACVQDEAPEDVPPPEPAATTIDGVPLQAAALHEYLRSGAYRAFPGEGAAHPSTGPHGGNVRTYLSPALATSLAGTAAHAKDAVAIKELYGSSPDVTGWAVAIKLRAESDAGKGWYWYEVFSTQPGAKAPYAGVGLALCANCHSAGRDYVLTPVPLR